MKRKTINPEISGFCLPVVQITDMAQQKHKNSKLNASNWTFITTVNDLSKRTKPNYWQPKDIIMYPTNSSRNNLKHSFIYFGYFYIAPLQVYYYSEALPTTALILCQSFHAKAPRAIASEGLAQGPYAADRVGFEPATLWSQGTELTTEPPRPKLYTVLFILK